MVHWGLFEDTKIEELIHVVPNRPVWTLRVGTHCLKEKLSLFFKTDPAFLLARPSLLQFFQTPKKSSMPVLLFNARLIFDPVLLKRIKPTGDNELFKNSGGDIVAMRLRTYDTSRSLESLEIKKTTIIEIPLMYHIHDIITQHQRCLASDIVWFKKVTSQRQKKKINYTHVICDTADGPVHIEKNVVIEPFTYIKGPAYIGSNSLIKSGSRLECVSIGNSCKVSGEVSETIIDSYSNKQHDGFVGHSYIGSWVNLGAGTTVSDLKNNYQPVKMIVNNKTIIADLFMGSAVADHVKTGICTHIPCGTVFGFGSLFTHTDNPAKFVKPFSFITPSGSKHYNLDKFLETTAGVMQRRKQTLRADDKAIITMLHTAAEKH